MRRLSGVALIVFGLVALIFLGRGWTTQDLIALLAGGPSGPQISGRPIATDGDSLRFGDTRIRLFGIDAPESAQTCQSPTGKIWRCGDVATAQLKTLIDGNTVICVEQDQDRYGRIVATCEVRGQDIGAWMVASGWAMAYLRYSTRYTAQERQARANRAGIWIGSVQPPWEWRAAR